jgi:hypothetical protein
MNKEILLKLKVKKTPILLNFSLVELHETLKQVQGDAVGER